MLQEQSINMSAGTLIINPLNEVLIVHPTLQEKYDIPKGGADPSDADCYTSPRPCNNNLIIDWMSANNVSNDSLEIYTSWRNSRCIL